MNRMSRVGRAKQGRETPLVGVELSVALLQHFPNVVSGANPLSGPHEFSSQSRPVKSQLVLYLGALQAMVPVVSVDKQNGAWTHKLIGRNEGTKEKPQRVVLPDTGGFRVACPVRPRQL